MWPLYKISPIVIAYLLISLESKILSDFNLFPCMYIFSIKLFKMNTFNFLVMIQSKKSKILSKKHFFTPWARKIFSKSQWIDFKLEFQKCPLTNRKLTHWDTRYSWGNRYNCVPQSHSYGKKIWKWEWRRLFCYQNRLSLKEAREFQQ